MKIHANELPEEHSEMAEWLTEMICSDNLRELIISLLAVTDQSKSLPESSIDTNSVQQSGFRDLSREQLKSLLQNLGAPLEMQAVELTELRSNSLNLMNEIAKELEKRSKRV